MKKLGDIDFRALNNSVHLFSPIFYNLRDIEEIIFLFRVTQLSLIDKKLKLISEFQKYRKRI
jgi:hypothetical protein